MSRLPRWALFLTCIGLIVVDPFSAGLRVARAQSEQDVAARHFDRATELLRRSDFAGAVLELEAAYAASPHPAVLHDLAEARAAAGQTLPALEALDHYARQLGDGAPTAERQRVARRVAELEQLVAVVELDVAPPDARVRLGERELGAARTVRLPPGTHEVTLEAPGRTPQRVQLRLAAGERRTLQLRAAPRAAVAPAILTAVCAVPDVRLSISGVDVGSSQQLAAGWAHVVEAGTHAVHFARAGYSPQVSSAQLIAGRETRVTCRLAPLPLNAATGSRLVLSGKHMAAAHVLVDGRPYAGGLLVPGAHQLEVRRFGYQPVRLALQARAGETQRVDVGLQPTAELEAWQAERRGVRQAWALALGGVGVLTSGTALGVFLDSRAQRESLQQTQRALNVEWQSVQPGSDLAQRQRQNDRRREAFHRWNKAAVGLGAAGVLLLAGGATLWLLGDESEAPGGVRVALDAAPRLEWSATW